MLDHRTSRRARRWAAIAIATVLGTGVARADLPAPGPLAQPAPLDQVGLPREILARRTPADNPATPAKVALGERLFFDGRLSADGTVSCATCHDPEKGFTDQRPTSVGIDRRPGRRNAPTVLNAALNAAQFWDGRAPTLEEQAKLPILNPIEMGRHAAAEVVTALAAIPEYAAGFRTVFGRPVRYADVARAIAAYERTQLAFDSRFDRFLAGDEGALSADERRGWAVFGGKGRCATCHAAPLFADGRFHDVGVAARHPSFAGIAARARAAVAGTAAERAGFAVDRLAVEAEVSELGRFLVTRRAADIGSFKTPGLRNLLVTQPYFHDGSAATLWDAIVDRGRPGAPRAHGHGRAADPGLTDGEVDDLAAFLGALTSRRYEEPARAELARQRERARTERHDDAGRGERARTADR